MLVSSGLTVIANLIIGSDGATSKNGSSLGLSTPADRSRFHEIRSQADAILIGGATARLEPYKKTAIPLFILTHSHAKLQPKNPLAKQLNMDPDLALIEISKYLSTKDKPILLVEAGPKLLKRLIELKKINKFYLTINHAVIGENKIEIKDFLKEFKLIESKKIGSDEFCEYQLAN